MSIIWIEQGLNSINELVAPADWSTSSIMLPLKDRSSSTPVMERFLICPKLFQNGQTASDWLNGLLL